VIAGGAEATLTPLAKAAFAAMDATSPSGISRPFDARRDGFVMGEAAGVLVLESAELAHARGARVLGEVLGYGATADAYHLTAPDPSGTSAARAILRALADAGMRPDDVDYVNAHGTSTPLNDRSETDALKLALGNYARHVPVSSTKSAIGHSLGAAGAVEAIATILALADRVAPPTLGYEEQEEGLDLDYVPDGPRPLRVRQNGGGSKPSIAISNSFGFGGHNAVLCLGGAPASAR
jgi:3-oxoacyl-[acyl-carrier-protein] synthase II